MKTKPFNQASHLSQVRRLRQLAKNALKHYDLNIIKIHFVNHGENTTFKLTDHHDNHYLLRVHRHNYHSFDAIHHELSWINHIAQTTNITVQTPIKNKLDSLLTLAEAPHMDAARFVSIMTWIDGKFLTKRNTKASDIEKLGILIGKLQKSGESFTQKHPKALQTRNYWHADGLLSDNATMGSDFNIPGISKKDQQILNDARLYFFNEIKAFEKNHSDRLGFIHADLHFGNFIKTTEGEIVPIDFDDCGFGFHAYDLAIPLMALQNDPPEFIIAFYTGYSSIMPLDNEDKGLIEKMKLIRRITLCAWIKDRCDTPEILETAPEYVEKTIQCIHDYHKAHTVYKAG